MYAHRSFLVLGGGAADIISLVKGGYEIANCEFSFEQGIDDTGKATTRVHGGNISLTLPMIPPNDIIAWAIDSRKYQDGAIITLDDQNMPVARILFENAACINFGIDFRQKGDSYTITNLVIQAEVITVGNGIEFLSEWSF
jgi:hypothetical protein